MTPRSKEANRLTIKSDLGHDGWFERVGLGLGGLELDGDGLGGRRGDHVGDGDGLGAGVQDEELHRLLLRRGVRGEEAEVELLLGTVDARVRTDLDLKRKVEELRPSGVGANSASQELMS